MCSARVQVFDPEGPDVVRRSASGIGDASPANVYRMMATALIRMAETRAKARALRDLCNVGMVSFEELGQEEPQSGRPDVRWMTPLTSPTANPCRCLSPGGGHRHRRAPVYKASGRAGVARQAGRGRGLGIALPPQLREVVPERTPLPALTGHSQEVRRLVEATQAGQR